MNAGFYAAAREELAIQQDRFFQERNVAGRIRTLNALGILEMRLARYDEAALVLQEALNIAKQVEIPLPIKLGVWANLIQCSCRAGRLDDGVQLVEEISDLVHQAEPALKFGYFLNRSALHGYRYEWDLMRQAAEAALEQARILESDWRIGRSLINVGIALMESGQQARAEQVLHEARQIAERDDPYTLSNADFELARLYFMLGHDERAVQAGRSALHLLFAAPIQVDKLAVAQVSYTFGQIFAKYGQRNLALKYLNRAAAYYSQLGFRGDWLRTTEAIGGLLSSPIRPARADLREETYQLDFLTAVLDLTDDLESVEPSLRGHSERVSVLASVIGRHLGLSEAELRTLMHAARLHDVGKAAIDAELLRRNGPLSHGEERRVSLHPLLGEEMVRPYGLPADGLAAIRHHHERWDGTGFPDRLAGEAIPLFARIIAIANAYDGWTMGTGDRQTLSHDQALDRLGRLAGSHFDPRLVRLFIEKAAELRAASERG
jgi:HD-GYP domain-containing protein (c-di-GMP phosphodiesterase class II)